jgi:multidrug efflux pump subunit AcrA (membrane-fusion protein)
MTATVSIIVRKAENALRIPAAALRFRPEGYQRPAGSGAASGSRAGAGRSGQGDAGGGVPGAAMASERGGAPGPRSPGGAVGQGRPGGSGAPGGGGGWGGGRGPPTAVFVQDEKGQPKALEVRVGISDGQFVEVREGLEEGAQVITGTEIPGARTGPRPTNSPSANPFTPQFQRRQR